MSFCPFVSRLYPDALGGNNKGHACIGTAL